MEKTVMEDVRAEEKESKSSTIRKSFYQRPENRKCRNCGRVIEAHKTKGQAFWFLGSECDVCREERYRRLYAEHIGPERVKKVTRMRKYLNSVIPPVFAKAHLRNLSKAFIKELFDYDPRVGLVLYGPPGTGKSYALCAYARYLILKGKICRRITYEMLCLMIRSSYSSGSKESELGVLERFIDCDYLFIEDVGATVSIGREESDFSLRTFLVLLDSRLERCRPTFISTNKTRESLTASFDERIGSRLSLFKWLGVGGQDRRKSEVDFAGKYR